MEIVLAIVLTAFLALVFSSAVGPLLPKPRPLDEQGPIHVLDMLAELLRDRRDLDTVDSLALTDIVGYRPTAENWTCWADALKCHFPESQPTCDGGEAPAGWTDLAEFARYVARCYPECHLPAEITPREWRMALIFITLRKLISEQLQMQPAEIRRGSNFIDDLLVE